MALREDIINFLAQHIPAGTIASVHSHDGDDRFHIDIEGYRTFLETEFLASLDDESRRLAEKMPPHQHTELLGSLDDEEKNIIIETLTQEHDTHASELDYIEGALLKRAVTEIDTVRAFYIENETAILEQMNSIFRSELSIPHVELQFPEPQMSETGQTYTMVEPWDHGASANNGEEYRQALTAKHRWVSLVETLRHYGANVEVIPTSEIDGTRDVWARDPAIVLDNNGSQQAFIYGDQYRLKSDVFDSYHAYLRENGTPTQTVNAEIEGGNTLVDTHNGVILYSVNISKLDDIGYVEGRQHLLAEKFSVIHEALKDHDGPWYRDLAETLSLIKPHDEAFADAYHAMAGVRPEDYSDRFGDLYDAIPIDARLKIDGIEVNTWSPLLDINGQFNMIMDEREGYYNSLNAQADALQEATEMPVIPIPMLRSSRYHLDTFAGVLSDGSLMIHPTGTDAGTMERLQSFYGDNLIILNDEDLQGLGSNFVEVGNRVITNHLSPETTTALNERGYEVVSAASLEYNYGFNYDEGRFQYIGSGIRCLTDEVYDITEVAETAPDEHPAYDAALPNKVPANMPRLQ